ncbi:hypothetical protein RFI_31466 [Reticulomyxa filosa]|uniref:Kelch motif family protein n=1 Tax=Reticulomyxa filosa TaxID=46433 RepID=X6LX71_RETFI|nr:hypothetical protein RFI_31466 [Reticulomyxa filosa]|eukprot:ETO05931.1 hypothetical protein RFI_31466 [Reticulomyxa filosa]
MGNQNTTQEPTPFQKLKDLPIPLWQSQCVFYKHELLVCGGYEERNCYSYHTLKNEYKFICSYPNDVKLNGHCVVKLVDDNDSNKITLLSFGGRYGHTLVMKYVSIWDNDIKKNKLNDYYKWIPFTNKNNYPINISSDFYQGARAVIGGSNNHLLFITYGPNNINVFDLNKFQYIKYDTLPTDNRIAFHCFVSKPENRQEIIKENNKKNVEMILFCFKTGLLIEYNEDNNTFQFCQIPVSNDIEQLYKYACICINDSIFFFGGWNYNDTTTSKLVQKYSIQENTWITFKYTLHIPLYSCFGILNEDNTHIHIIGGSDDKNTIVSVHMKTRVNEWRELVIFFFFFFALFLKIKYK